MHSQTLIDSTSLISHKSDVDGCSEEAVGHGLRDGEGHTLSAEESDQHAGGRM